MNQHINWVEVSNRIALPDGLVVVLLNRLGMENRYGRLECSRNIFLIDTAEKIIWQVSSDFDVDGGPFTNLLNENGKIKGYRWDGGLYQIDIKNGYAKPISLMK